MNTIPSLTLQHNVNLKSFNTFGMNVSALDFVEITDETQLPALLRMINQYQGKVLFMGGGSNMLFTGNFNGLVVRILTKGIEIVDQDDEFVYVRAMAGEVWDDFVQYCVRMNYGGLENLSLIPGNVGSSPLQNIGAYGAEIKDTFYMLDAVSLRTGEFREFYTDECDFGYRSSVFKHELKGQYLILSVTFRLRKNPLLNVSYGAIAAELEKMGESPSVKSIARAVCNIRRSKLPDPLEIGNAGSFFKNPVVDKAMFEKLKLAFPDMPAYQAPEGYKLAAGWLIEKCGWKGFRKGDAGVHAHQALVLVNYGNAGGIEILELSRQIIDSVSHKFNVILEPEVNII
ncbi:MAG: UDP-N-acetylmuramate dehydrogenase [Lentimicrobiaceae bacterium]|nr:UDP-N-acetylmuramate dehydrogenase [Lentimicrobiaceae bacterium]MCB9023493.1 UDP-N-acetylmuramate dehydrogenase [Lentimicrobiaceae bacterium]MCO5265320.1 UDP-N-acetylmuramate dehydrogenase [Lentimicrobium sp.]